MMFARKTFSPEFGGQLPHLLRLCLACKNLTISSKESFSEQVEEEKYAGSD